jgi:hypothetical protein
MYFAPSHRCHRDWLSGAAQSVVPAILPPRDAQRLEAAA